MFLVAIAAAMVALSSGAAVAQQVVVCNPMCGLTTANEHALTHGQNGRDTAAATQTQQNGNSGGGNTGGGGGTVVVK
jgi:hypothetical protein